MSQWHWLAGLCSESKPFPSYVTECNETLFPLSTLSVDVLTYFFKWWSSQPDRTFVLGHSLALTALWKFMERRTSTWIATALCLEVLTYFCHASNLTVVFVL